MSSPFAFAYPKWEETAKEIYQPTRFRIYLPAPQPDKIRLASNPMRALMDKVTDISKWRKDDDEPKLPSAFRLHLSDLIRCEANLTDEECDLIRVLVQLFADEHPSFETLKEIAEYAEKVVKQEKES